MHSFMVSLTNIISLWSEVQKVLASVNAWFFAAPAPVNATRVLMA
jgi:hypothetical protein